MAIMRQWKWIGVLLCFCVLLPFGLSLGYRKIKALQREKLLQKIFATEAESLRRGMFKMAIPEPEGTKRREEAIQLLSNGVFDEKVLLVAAQLRPPTRGKYEHPLFRNSPSLCWVVVDELQQVTWVGYSDPNDPNAFGTPLFTIGQYCSLSPYGIDEMPKHTWLLPLKCYGETDLYLGPHRRLMKYDNGISQPHMSLEVTVSEWNAMLSNRGQLILRGRNGHELDRVEFTPIVDEEERKIMKSLMFPIK